MNAFSFPFRYISWHYTEALLDIFGIAKNYSWAIAHVFSVRVLISTLFTPWHRMNERGEGLFTNPGVFLGNVLINFVLRLIGFVVRSFIILFSILSWALLFAVTIFVYITWLVLPLSLIALSISGITLLFI